jgi:hypothetical protein
MNTEILPLAPTTLHNARCEVLGVIHQAFRENPSDGPVSTKKRWLTIHAALGKAKEAAGDLGLNEMWDAAAIKLDIERANRRCDRLDVLELARQYLDVLGRVS